MKKLLALTLVLGMASLATAGLDLATLGLSYSYAGNTVTITGAGNVTAFQFNLEADNGSVLSNAVVAAGFTTYKSNGMWAGTMWEGATGVNAAALASGTIFTIDFTPGTQKLTFVYSGVVGGSYVSIAGQDVILDTVEMTVPEPMTMTLLGLGSLFLARRKK